MSETATLPPGKTSPRRTSGRVRCIDWLRGLAVLGMVMWHSACLLSKGLDASSLGMIAGLVAPSFMFASGYAVALLMARSASDPAKVSQRAKKSLRRVGEVMLVALFLKYMMRYYEPYWYLKIDILTCIALGLLACLGVLRLTVRKPWVSTAVCAVLALGCFGLAPVVPDGWWGVLVSPHSSDFALVPWAGYVLLGAAAGVVSARGLAATAWSFAGLVLLGAALKLGGPVWAELYNPWILTNAGERLMKFCGLALLLFALEVAASRWKWAAGIARALWPVDVVGTNALTAYVAHVWILYIAFPWNFTVTMKWAGRLSWSEYWVMLFALCVSVVLFCWGWAAMWRALTPRLPWKKPRTA